jgi:hypothetical protein
MRSIGLAFFAAALLVSCGEPTKPASPEPAQSVDLPKPSDETRRFPLANRTATEVVANHLLDKGFMPGGTLAHFHRGQTDYQMFVAKAPTAQDAAFLLLDWRKALTAPQIVPEFGGYSGQDAAGVPVFVFSKNTWIAGVAGLPAAQANLEARSLAAHLN